jgi:hypothetical protein
MGRPLRTGASICRTVLYLPAGAILLTGLGFGVFSLVFGDLEANWPQFLGFGCGIASLGILVGGLVYSSRKVRPMIRPQVTAVTGTRMPFSPDVCGTQD